MIIALCLQAEHAGDLSSYPTTVYLPDGDDYCSASRLGKDDVDDGQLNAGDDQLCGSQLSRSVPASSGVDLAPTSCTRASLVRPEDRQKWVNPPPNKNPFSNCAPPTSRSRQRLTTHTGASGMRRPAAPVTVRHDSWSHSSPSADHHQEAGVARTLPDTFSTFWRPENLPTLPARSPPSRQAHGSSRTAAAAVAAGAAAATAQCSFGDSSHRCSLADCLYCSSSSATSADRR